MARRKKLYHPQPQRNASARSPGSTPHERLKDRAQKKMNTSKKTRSVGLTSNPRWYQDAVIYEIPIRAYCDSNGDGVGDLPGLISKLDYLVNLGVDALWLLPFYPSPMRDGGYDISDYISVHPMYGSLDDFKELLVQAHARGIRIITELVINHTSKDHPWFERARQSPAGSKWRNFYVWSESGSEYSDTRIIFKDFETSNWSWDPVAKAHYWHRFYAHQPDLNFDNPDVQAALFEVLDFWLGLGVDGLRLDAVPYLYEREGTNCENLPETHAYLKKLRAYVDAKYKDRMLLAEANQWPQDAAAYFGNGDECHMNFHFPLMPRLFMALQLEDRFPVIDILQQTPDIPDNCQWATFLRNHDELTLEMVTDQDRDYMYEVYAADPNARINLGIRRRLAPLLKSRQKIELINSLLFSLPGTPVLYYGDELGMGDNIHLPDRDGVRTPMQWSADRNAGFSRANPQKLFLPTITDPEYHYEAINVEAQEYSPHSLLWFTRRLIAVAKKNNVLGKGNIEFLRPDNNKILAYLRTHAERRVLCVVNLSRFPQCAELDLQAYEGAIPVEMFSNVRFPTIEKGSYRLTLSPHAFFWFNLEPAENLRIGGSKIVQLDAQSSTWHTFVDRDPRGSVTAALLNYVVERRWFRGKSRMVREAQIVEAMPLGHDADATLLILFRLEYVEGNAETYCIPLGFFIGDDEAQREKKSAHALVARINGVSYFESETLVNGSLYDTFATSDAALPLLRSLEPLRGKHGSLRAVCETDLRRAIHSETPPTLKAPELEQSNTVVFIGDCAILKLYRHIEEGMSPELEVGTFLAQRMGTSHLIPKIVGSIAYQQEGRPASTLGIAQELVQNEGDAWQLTLSEIENFFVRVLSQEEPAPTQPEHSTFLDRIHAPVPALLADLGGRYFALARQLGQRVAEMHRLLGQSSDDKAFAPEPFNLQHQQSVFQWAHTSIARTFEKLRRKQIDLPADTQRLLESLLPAEKSIDDMMRRIINKRIDAARIRLHGDLHLGQVLFTGADFVIIDFEGEPGRPINERRYKRSALRDAVGMVRSFSYAVHAVLRSGRVRAEDIARLTPWGHAWSSAISAVFLKSYLEALHGTALVPTHADITNLLLEFYEIEKVIYEVEYELNNRPDWLHIPLAGLTNILANHRG
jgi:maltose alpha-D-glucosyltransferase/alpha-amylase